MKQSYQVLMSAFVLLVGFAASPRVEAHCDTLNGPVVQDARAALSTGKVEGVLKWVKSADESAIRTAFEKAKAVRSQSGAVADLADTYFFETLVRLHRASEGEPYTGLKAEPVEHGIQVAEEALASADAGHLSSELAEKMKTGLQQRFQRVVEARKHASHSVEAGRDYVAAYVAFMHFTEQMFSLVGTAPDAHHHAAHDSH